MSKAKRKKKEAASSTSRREPRKRSGEPTREAAYDPTKPREAAYDPMKHDSIETHLDMKEKGSMRGDEILHHHGMPTQLDEDVDIRSVDEMMENFHTDMSESDREGDEMSGDDHSSGFQGIEHPVTQDSDLRRMEESTPEDYYNEKIYEEGPYGESPAIRPEGDVHNLAEYRKKKKRQPS